LVDPVFKIPSYKRNLQEVDQENKVVIQHPHKEEARLFGVTILARPFLALPILLLVHFGADFLTQIS